MSLCDHRLLTYLGDGANGKSLGSNFYNIYWIIVTLDLELRTYDWHVVSWYNH